MEDCPERRGRLASFELQSRGRGGSPLECRWRGRLRNLLWGPAAGAGQPAARLILRGGSYVFFSPEHGFDQAQQLLTLD